MRFKARTIKTIEEFSPKLTLAELIELIDKKMFCCKSFHVVTSVVVSPYGQDIVLPLNHDITDIVMISKITLIYLPLNCVRFTQYKGFN